MLLHTVSGLFFTMTALNLAATGEAGGLPNRPQEAKSGEHSNWPDYSGFTLALHRFLRNWDKVSGQGDSQLPSELADEASDTAPGLARTRRSSSPLHLDSGCADRGSPRVSATLIRGSGDEVGRAAQAPGFRIAGAEEGGSLSTNAHRHAPEFHDLGLRGPQPSPPAPPRKGALPRTGKPARVQPSTPPPPRLLKALP